MTEKSEIRSKVREYILREFLPGEDPDALEDDTPLITGGILDSISTVKLVTFLEVEFGVTFEAHEIGVDHLNTVNDISAVVSTKMTN